MLVEVVWVTAIVEMVISLAVPTGEMKWRKVVFELGRLLLLSGVRVRTAAFSFFFAGGGTDGDESWTAVVGDIGRCARGGDVYAGSSV